MRSARRLLHVAHDPLRCARGLWSRAERPWRLANEPLRRSGRLWSPANRVVHLDPGLMRSLGDPGSSSARSHFADRRPVRHRIVTVDAFSTVRSGHSASLGVFGRDRPRHAAAPRATFVRLAFVHSAGGKLDERTLFSSASSAGTSVCRAAAEATNIAVIAGSPCARHAAASSSTAIARMGLSASSVLKGEGRFSRSSP